MKYSFLTGLVLGFAGLLGAAWAYPWVQHARFPSQTEVVPNGGRAERFVIRLPADRIGGYAASASGTVGPAPVPRPGRADGLSIEQFKVRDAAGRVIGVAARHATAAPGGGSIAWIVAIPGRGTMVLAEANGAVDPLEPALVDAGVASGTAWEGELTVEAIGGGEAPQFSAGTDEFAGLEIAFAESWNVTGVDAEGALRGTIELATISRGGA